MNCRTHASRLALLLLTLIVGGPENAGAQMPFGFVVRTALRNSPRVKLVEDEVRRAQAVLEESHDVYIPRVSASGGLGDAYGITLTVPTIFTIGAQSLVFSAAQRDSIRAARLELEGARRNLEEIRDQVVEDTAITYLLLDHAQQIHAALVEEQAHARTLSTIVEERSRAGLEGGQEVRIAARTVLQMRLQILLNEDDMANLREHLGQLTGLEMHQMVTVPESIPAMPAEGATKARVEMPGLLSAEANAHARLERAFGDARFAWWPEVEFQAQYGRISPIVDVSSYYNIQGNYNTFSGGLAIQFPFFDAGRKARARQSAADASHAFHEADRLRGQLAEDALRLQHAMAELQVRVELADMEEAIAQDQLKSVLIDLEHGGFAAPPRTPKEEQNARMRERQTYIDVLDGRLQLRRTQVSLLRQTGELSGWALSEPAARR